MNHDFPEFLKYIISLTTTGAMISRVLTYYFMILAVIVSFPVVNTLRIPQGVTAQTTSEAVKVLVDDVIQDLKYHDMD